MKIALSFAALVAAAVVSSSASSQVRYVHPSGSDSNQGDGWGSSDAWQTLDHALAVLSGSSPGFDTIYIASGTYLPEVPSSGDPRLATFAVTKRVAIYGGFNAASPESSPALRTLGAYPTILFGDLDEDDDPEDDGTLVDNAYHVMTITASFSGATHLILDGLNFEAGVADGEIVANTNIGGAVVWLDTEEEGNGKLLARHCRFERNRAATSGGALYSQFDTELRHSSFENNLATALGGTARGGAVVIEITPNLESVSRLVASNCTFVDNLAFGTAVGGFPPQPADALGGAIYAMGGGVIANCEFRGNQAQVDGSVGLFGGRGGAIWFEDLNPEDDRRVTNCVFVGNSSRSRGGALEAYVGIVIRSCTIADNTATDESGGGVQLFGESTGPIPDSFLWNCMVWDNTAGTLEPSEQQVATSSGGDIFVDHSIIEGEDELGAPDFVNPSVGDYRLAEGSRGIDDGDNDLLDADAADVDDDADLMELHPRDLDSLRRISVAFCAVDVGAYEFVPSCIADLDGDESVDASDLAILLGGWGSCSDPCCPDLTGDEVVDATDLAILLGAWGSCSSFMMMSSEGSTLLDAMEEPGFASVEAFEAWLLTATDEEVHGLVEN